MTWTIENGHILNFPRIFHKFENCCISVPSRLKLFFFKILQNPIFFIYHLQPLVYRGKRKGFIDKIDEMNCKEPITNHFHELNIEQQKKGSKK